VSCFSAETRWAPMLGGTREFGRNPRTRIKGKLKRSSTQLAQEETKNLLKTTQTSKVVNPFTRALTPPFIRRRRDFYIPKKTSSLRNIPGVNMYMNVFYISYIYKPATSSHTKPRLFEMTSLTCFLLISESPHSRNLRAPRLPNSISSRFPNFADSRFRGFARS
jgi:hypothetical protein